jgi:hypothetical protein
MGRRDLPGSGVLQGNSLEYFRLRRVAVDRLGQPLERHLVSDRERQLADHFTGMRRDERRPHDLATAAAGINRRKPLFFAVEKSAFYLGQIEPIGIDRDTFFAGSARRQADLGHFGVGIGAMRNDQFPRWAIRSTQRVGDS